jgi:hypothetical protein
VTGPERFFVSRTPEPVPIFVLLTAAACAAASLAWQLLELGFVALVGGRWDPDGVWLLFSFLPLGIAGGLIWFGAILLYAAWLVGVDQVPKSPAFWITPRLAADLAVPLGLLTAFETFMRVRRRGWAISPPQGA